VYCDKFFLYILLSVIIHDKSLVQEHFCKKSLLPAKLDVRCTDHKWYNEAGECQINVCRSIRLRRVWSILINKDKLKECGKMTPFKGFRIK